MHDNNTNNLPHWDTLYELSAGQQGFFTARQARDLGYSPQLLGHHQRAGRLKRVRHGVYRLVHFPASENEDLVVIWLWSQQQGVFSHQTALALHDLSDVLPARVHVTLPDAWRVRRLRVPNNVVLHHGDIVERDRVWHGCVPVTSPVRTVIDCAQAGVSPDLIKQAIDDGVQRGLFSEKMLAEALAFLNLNRNSK